MDDNKKKKYYVFPKKICIFCKEKIPYIDYKRIDLLKKCLLENGRIKPARSTGTCRAHQKQLALAIKRARHLALISYVEDIREE